MKPLLLLLALLSCTAAVAAGEPINLDIGKGVKLRGQATQDAVGVQALDGLQGLDAATPWPPSPSLDAPGATVPCRSRPSSVARAAHRSRRSPVRVSRSLGASRWCR